MTNNIVSSKGNELPLVKIYWGKTSQRAQITLLHNYGGQNMALLNQMCEIAKNDFPDAGLEENDMNAVALGGPSRKHMWGIEFSLPADISIPDSYKKGQSEYILSGG